VVGDEISYLDFYRRSGKIGQSFDQAFIFYGRDPEETVGVKSAVLIGSEILTVLELYGKYDERAEVAHENVHPMVETSR